MNDTQYEQIVKKLMELDKRIEKIEDWISGFTRFRSLEYNDTPDSMYTQAEALVKQYDAASASLLQRRLSIGYARAARILDQLTEKGVISQADGAKPRKVLIKHES